MIVELLKERFVTRGELSGLFNMSDRNVRACIADLKKEFPIISTSNQCGYKIATTESDLPLVEDSLRNNRNKAIAILVGMKKLKEFYRQHRHEEFEQMTLEL